MTPEEQKIVDRKLKEIAEIPYNNTSDEELNTFETIGLSVREHLLKSVAPKIGEFFFSFSSRNKCGGASHFFTLSKFSILSKAKKPGKKAF